MPPPQQPNLQYVNIRDFSPGIQQRVNRTGGKVAPVSDQSAATLNTYRCIALPTGGLGPLPKRRREYTPTIPTPGPVSANDYDTFACVGFYVFGGVFDSGQAFGGITTAEFHIAYEYIFDNAGTKERRFRWEVHRMFTWTGQNQPVTKNTVKTINSTETSPLGDFRRCYFSQSRMAPSTATDPGVPILGAGWFVSTGAFESFWSTYPDPSAPGTTGTKNISTTLDPELLIAHQNRLLVFDLEGFQHGSNGQISSDENIWWTKANLPTIDPTVAQTFGTELYTGYLDAASTSASELFLVKKMRGGGYVIRGDINNPTVLHLPSLPSGARGPQGAYSPVGYVYMADGFGAYLWGGGDGATLISPQLENDFFMLQNYPAVSDDGKAALITSHILESPGKSEAWGEYTLFPNNWLWEAKTQSFWRIEDPEECQILHWSADGAFPLVWGAVPAFDGSSPLIYGWDPRTPASSYQWESQPLPQTVDADVIARQIVLTAQAETAATIVVTLTGLDGATEDITFSIPAADYAIKQVANCALIGTHIQVKIAASADDGESGAPITWDVAVGYHENNLIPAA